MLNLRLYLGDTFDILKAHQEKWKHKFQNVFADPPYFLSSGSGILERPEGSFKKKGVQLYKGDWDDISDWRDIYTFNYQWMKLVKPLIKENGTVWICGMWNQNLWTVRLAMEELGYSHLNNITIYKPNAVPNLKGVRFAASTECMIWAMPYQERYFAYKRMRKYNKGKQMRDMWIIPVDTRSNVGKHTTQKSFEQVRRSILATTDEGDWVLDPFAGSCTTMRICKELNRSCVCIEKGYYFPDGLSHKYTCTCGAKFEHVKNLIQHHRDTGHTREFIKDIKQKVGWNDSSLDGFTDLKKINIKINKPRQISYKLITKHFRDDI
jgi:site-specific DNA-methyltransferase (adenine-specific)